MQPTEEFRENLRRAGIRDDKPLAAVMTSLFETAMTAKDAVQGGARGLTPDAEAELVRRVVRSVETSMKDSLARHRMRLERRASWIAGGVVATSVLLGWAGGWWWGWSGGRHWVQSVEREVSAAFRAGPEAAEAWVRLMESNDPRTALEKCRDERAFESQGRKACWIPLWIEAQPRSPNP